MAISIQYWANYTAEKPKLMRKSENAVICNHVLKFLFDQETKMIHAVVQASMRNTSYKVTAILGSSYEVSNTSCECPLGKYECHHVASALLYGYKCVSKTDIKCGWLKNPKTSIKKDIKTMEELFPPARQDYCIKMDS
ncbi:uncharacterized protein LOC133201485 [Saccostrea echinata]|uniref:uncharacterized protein LOC133201485 n=1 Tax=Saccostrea echinata TaxID=191078 RepID=UPI002A83F5EB|nr:uncharacterized protein LOC133201485 [Saccostrea echinata]